MGHASRRPRQQGGHLCKPHKHRDAGQSQRKPFPDLRRIGKLRHDLGDTMSGE